MSVADDSVLAAGDGDDARSSARLRALRDGDEPRDREASGWGSVRTTAVWHGGGTRDAYEALLVLLFAPEREPVERECE